MTEEVDPNDTGHLRERVAEAIERYRRRLDRIAERHGQTGLHQVAMDAVDELEADVAALLDEFEQGDDDQDDDQSEEV